MSERDQVLVAYLLGELSADERAELEARLVSDPGLARELDARRASVAALGSLPDAAWDPPEPPPLALPVSDIPAGRPTEPTAARRWPWTMPRLGLAAIGAIAVAAVAALLISALGEDATSTRDASTIALRPFDEGPASAAGSLALGEGDMATLAASGLPPSAGDFYEVWLLGEQGLVSLGSFRVGASGEAELELRIPVDPSAYEAYDVSLEPDDGDPGHSGTSVLRGPART